MALKRLRRVAPASEPVLELHYLLLLITLLSSFVLSTLPRFGLPARLLISVVSLGLVFAALRSVWGNRKTFVAALVFGCGFAVARTAELLAPLVSLQVVSELLAIGFLAIVGGAVILHIARSSRITKDTIYGAVCVYFMLALLWASFYRLVFIADPRAFHLPEADAAAASGSVDVWFSYYSMITLTTIGYGDITPVSPVARSLTTLEGLTGQLYIAITIARLVGMQLVSGGKPDRSE